MHPLFPLMTLLWLSSLPVYAAPARVQRGQPTLPSGLFREDSRLQAPVRLAVKDRPLEEILAALTVQLHLPLTAERAVGDQMATLYLESRPASDVLARLAQHLALSWKKQGSGYRLVWSAEAQQRVAAARKREQETRWTLLRNYVGTSECTVRLLSGRSHLLLRTNGPYGNRRPSLDARGSTGVSHTAHWTPYYLEAWPHPAGRFRGSVASGDRPGGSCRQLHPVAARPRDDSGKRCVVDLLDSVGHALHYRWRQERRLIFLRSRIPHRDRPTEVSYRLLTPWKRQLHDENGASLDSLSTLALGLDEARVGAKLLSPPPSAAHLDQPAGISTLQITWRRCLLSA